MTELSPYIVYAAPPLIGAFIGYLTNKVAIKMLFRPLKRCRIGPIRIPMTPGVIPSKRHELAANIGEMVGEHLLTGDEINRALQKDTFQQHLQILIETKTATFLKMDLGSLKSIVPPSYKNYFDIGFKTIVYRIKKSIYSHMGNDSTTATIEMVVDKWLYELFKSDLNQLFPVEQRKHFSKFLQSAVNEQLDNPEFEDQLKSFIKPEIDSIFTTGKSCTDLFPQQLQDLIVETIRNQTPYVLDRAAAIVQDPDVRDSIVETIKLAIDEFIDTLGPMSTMVRGFLDMDLLDQKIREFIDDKSDDIGTFFHQEEIQIRVRAGLGERITSLMSESLPDFLTDEKEKQIDTISTEFARQVLNLIKKPESRQTIAHLINEAVVNNTEQGRGASGFILEKVVGRDLLESTSTQIKHHLIAALQSPAGLQIVDRLVDELSTRMISRPIGRLDHLIPSGVTEGICNSLQKMTTKLLISEVPGIVKSINIKKIVTDKIDSFDLLRLEKLLLSIMAEQFKYINLFGALLGFLIGCLNLLLLVAR